MAGTALAAKPCTVGSGGQTGVSRLQVMQWRCYEGNDRLRWAGLVGAHDAGEVLSGLGAGIPAKLADSLRLAQSSRRARFVWRAPDKWTTTHSPPPARALLNGQP